MKMKVLRPGCPRREALKEATRQALFELRMDREIEEIKKVSEIMEYLILFIPALAVNEKVVFLGEFQLQRKLRSFSKRR